MSLRFLLLVFFLTLSPKLLSWSAFEHMLVAELAFQNLDPKVQQQLEAQSFELVKKQTTDQRLYLLRTFPGTSYFAQMAVFADTHKQLSIEELFTTFAVSVPAKLRGMEEETTGDWHFKERAFQPETLTIPGMQAPEQCDITNPTNISWAIEKMQEALKEAENNEDQTLALAMLIHLVADAHQPLHAMSKVDEDCASDFGGSRFCVKYRTKSYSCETNLRAFWDSSLGFFEDFESVGDASEFLARVNVDDQLASNLDPEEWLNEGYRLARFVYSISDGSGGDPYYVQEGQVHSYERLALASRRLLNILQQLFPSY